MANITRPIPIDFETNPIYQRPEYPPEPVGVSILVPGEKRPRYYAWGHPTGNNCDKKDAQNILRTAWKSGEDLLFHNGKFDVDVAETHMGVPRDIDPLRIHDTMFLLFLEDPHLRNLGLKATAEQYLGMPPKERDAVLYWLVQHQAQLKADGLLPHDEPRLTLQNAGKWICLGPGDLVGTYAEGDVTRTLKLFRKLYPNIVARGMLPAYQREQRLMPILLENEREGIDADQRALNRDVKQYTAAMETADNWLRKTLKAPELEVDSDAQIAEALHRAGVVTEWETTKTGKRSTSKKNLKPEHFHNRNVASVLGYRNRLATCLRTFMRPWQYTASKSGGRIHTNWNQVRQTGSKDNNSGARTGRLSSSPNFQNIPKDFTKQSDGYAHPKVIKVPELPLMRKYLLPDKGEVWCRRDQNQQELRLVGHFDPEGTLQRAYVDNPTMDTHAYVQNLISNLLGIELERTPVKTLNFGYIYGQGIASMAEKLQRAVNEIQRFRKAQMEALPGLKDLSDKLKGLARDEKPITTWGGREYYCEDPKYDEDRDFTRTFEYKLLNYLIQGSAADVTKEVLIRFHHHPKRKVRVLVNVHDEVNFSSTQRLVKEQMLLLRDVILSIELKVPMLSDGEVGSSWGALKKLAGEPAYDFSHWS